MMYLRTIVSYLIVPAALSVSCVSCLTAQTATQLAFASLIPSNQLENFTLPPITVFLEDANGNIVDNSSTSVTLSLSGPGISKPIAQTQTTSAGVVTFSLGTTLVNAGLYGIAVTSQGLPNANQVIGVDVAMMPPQGTILTGAYVDADSGSPEYIGALEKSIGRTLALHTYYWPFDQSFPNSNITNPTSGDEVDNRIPVLSWRCITAAGVPITDNDIVTGLEDTTISALASQIAIYGRPVIIRYMWEMNLATVHASCLETSGPNSGASGYQLAWQHIYNLFMAQRAFNVIWLFNPGSGSGLNPSAFNPGDAYVDIVGVDSYNPDPSVMTDPFGPTFNSGIPGQENIYHYSTMAATHKPLMVGETGAYAVNQATYFDNGIEELQQAFPNFIAFDIFDASGGSNGDFSLSTDTPGGLSEYTKLVNSSYLSASYTSPLGFTTYPFNTRIHTSSPVSSVAFGSQVSLSAEILNDAVNPASPAEPTGSLYIYSNSTLLATYSLPSACTSSSAVSCRVDGIDITLAGSDATQDLVAAYSGDSNNGGGQSWPVPITITPAPSIVKLSVVANPAAQGITDTLTATVTGAGQPSGSVIFLSGSAMLCTSTLNTSGVATCTFTPSVSGTLSITAQYQGDADHSASSSSLSLNVYDRAVTQQFSSTELIYPGATNVTTCVTGATNATPTGTIQVDAGSNVLTTLSLQGNGCGYYYISPGLNAGTYSLTSVYSGDQNNRAGTSLPAILRVSPVPVKMSASCWNSSFSYGANYQCAVNASSNTGPALGNIAYSYDGGVLSLIPLSNGNAQFTITKPSAGDHSLAILYAQQTNFASATPQSESFTVAPAPVQVSLTPSAWYTTEGSSITFQASVSSWSAGTPNNNGAISFYNGTALLATVLVNSNGQASYTSSSLPIGSQIITATYAGGTNFSSGSTNVTVTIAQ